MKKILSALALGAAAAGMWAADISIGGNYRNGIEVFKYINKGDEGRNVDEYGNVYIDSGYAHSATSLNMFNLTGWNSGKDNISLKASGGIFSFNTTIQPAIGSDNVVFHILGISANVSGFSFTVGWNGDGVMNYRVKKDADDGNEEGKVFEAFKLGSAFGTDATCSNNQVSFNTGRNFYAQAGYSLALPGDLSLKIQATIMSDRLWDNPAAATRNHHPGWAVFLTPKMNGVFDAELFVKGYKDAKDKQTLVLGAYGKPLGVPLLNDSAVGASFRLYDGKLEEWNADLRTRFVSGGLSITTMSKFAKLVRNADHSKATTDGAATYALAGLTSPASSQVLWDMVSARYKMSDLITLVGTVGHITDLDSGFNNGRDSNDGTIVYAHPHAQIYANSKITVTAGVLCAVGGIGADDGANKDIDILVNVPVLIRVKF